MVGLSDYFSLHENSKYSCII